MTPEELYKGFSVWRAGIERVDSDSFRDAVETTAMRIPESDRDKWFGQMIMRLGHMELASPIEGLFAMWWMVREYERPELRSHLDFVPRLSAPLGGSLFRFDFCVMPHTRDEALAREIIRTGLIVVIELDGHVFHERTKDQVRARNRKDRAVQTANFAICHFSGSEVVGDGEACVDAAVELVESRGLLDYARRNPGPPR